MFATLSTVVEGIAGKRRTHAPVHRNSRPAGKCEAMIWRKTKRQDVKEIVLAAKRYEIAMKQPGKRTGPLGAVALEVLELLSNLVDYNTGRLEPSLDTMMRHLRRSRDAIVRGLQALKDHGFVNWLRRFVSTDNEGNKGPQVRQTSNAYTLLLPAKGRAALGRYGKAPPLPEDQEQATAERETEVKTYRASMTMEEIVYADVDPGNLQESLARAARLLMKQRESAEQTESQPESIYIRKRSPLSGSLTLPCGGSVPPYARDGAEPTDIEPKNGASGNLYLLWKERRAKQKAAVRKIT